LWVLQTAKLQNVGVQNVAAAARNARRLSRNQKPTQHFLLLRCANKHSVAYRKPKDSRGPIPVDGGALRRRRTLVVVVVVVVNHASTPP
jgi:hypothetical protein